MKGEGQAVFQAVGTWKDFAFNGGEDRWVSDSPPLGHGQQLLDRRRCLCSALGPWVSARKGQPAPPLGQVHSRSSGRGTADPTPFLGERSSDQP